jgi:hypothetical protein
VDGRVKPRQDEKASKAANSYPFALVFSISSHVNRQCRRTEHYGAEIPLLPASPFVRKVLVFAHEIGLAEPIDVVLSDVWAPDGNIFRDNPLGKVLALVSDGASDPWTYSAIQRSATRLAHS